MKKSLILTFIIWCLFLYWCTNQTEVISEKENETQYSCSTEDSGQNSCAIFDENQVDEIDIETLTEQATNIIDKIWGLNPEVALEYMQVTDDLIIIDTRDLDSLPNWFIWSIAIPWNQIANRVSEIPEWSKVLLHCGGGNVSPKAYRALLETNPKLESLAYIAGTPLFDEYNNRIESTR